MAEGTSLAEDRNRGAELIEGVLAGRFSPEEALEQWPEPIDSLAWTLTEAWTNLQHFGDDQDLFAKDAGYAAACRERLEKLAVKLRAEAVELGDKPSTHSRSARMFLGLFGYGVGYVPLMGIITSLGDIGVAQLSLLLGFVGLIVWLLLTLLGCCSKRLFLFGAMFGLSIHAAFIARMWYEKMWSR